LKNVIFTPLRRIATPGGDVMHGMKMDDAGYRGFGEVYFSWVAEGTVKGWKRHRQMTLNLVVPLGKVRFLMCEHLEDAETPEFVERVVCSETHYGRLTIPPGIWVAFQGIGPGSSLVANIADMPHDPDEVDRQGLDSLEYPWA
jgi:dTDP-4-dehydrorhamnose 3,5-epimerase